MGTNCCVVRGVFVVAATVADKINSNRKYTAIRWKIISICNKGDWMYIDFSVESRTNVYGATICKFSFVFFWPSLRSNYASETLIFDYKNGKCNLIGRWFEKSEKHVIFDRETQSSVFFLESGLCVYWPLLYLTQPQAIY